MLDVQYSCSVRKQDYMQNDYTLPLDKWKKVDGWIDGWMITLYKLYLKSNSTSLL